MRDSPLGALARLAQLPVEARLREATWLDEATGAKVTVEAPPCVCVTQLEDFYGTAFARTRMPLPTHASGGSDTFVTGRRPSYPEGDGQVQAGARDGSAARRARRTRCIEGWASSEWLAREAATDYLEVPVLERLAGYVEQQRDAIAPMLLSQAESMHLEILRALGALTPSTRRTPRRCPDCHYANERRTVRTHNRCRRCGRIFSSSQETRWAPDDHWLRRRIAQALGLPGKTLMEMVEGHVWRLGDIGKGLRRRRVLYGQRLSRAVIHRALHAVWNAHVGDMPAVLVTTTPVERLLVNFLVPVQAVSLAAAFRVRGRGLVMDGSIWNGVMNEAPLLAAERQGPFASDFRQVWLPEETGPIALTPTQAKVMRALWEQRPQRMEGDVLMRYARLNLLKPVDAFTRAKYPEANRAYHVLVRSNRAGEYWLVV